MRAPLLFALLVASGARGAVRQRVFNHSAQGSSGGTEAIVHWDSSTVKISAHQFSGNLGSGASLNFGSVQPLFGNSVRAWTNGFTVGLAQLVPALSVALSGGNPYATADSCETDTAGDPDGVNNLIFSSKIADPNCAELIPQNYGIIGLTKVRYNSVSGLVVEADIQFDDRNFEFKASGLNNQTTDEMNLNDVAVHELGHFFGLDHVPTRPASMLFAVADDLQTPKSDDLMGLFSLYRPSGAAAALGGLRGSVTDGEGKGAFGVMVFLVNPRTMKIAASEITDVNGAYEFCAVPAGPYVVFANRYMPYGGNSEKYYSGDGHEGGTYEVNGVTKCFNPACDVMDTTLQHAFFAKAPTGNGGYALRIVNVAAGQTKSFVNIAGSSSPTAFTPVGGSLASPGSALKPDEPRVARLGTGSLPVGGSGSNVGTDVYSFVAPSTNVLIRTASLGIYARLKLSLNVPTVTCSPSPALALGTGTDPGLSCSGLTAGATYKIEVTATAASCRDIPGNVYGNISSSCVTMGEDASTPYPFYLINVFAAALEADTGLAENDVFAASSGAGTEWKGMPTCSSTSGNIGAGSSGGCCGSIGTRGPRPPSGPLSFLMGLALSPFVWFAAWWAFRRQATPVGRA